MIVPTFDEEAELPELFDHLDSLDGRLGGPGRGRRLARPHARRSRGERGAVVVAEGEHRAGQLNAAAARAGGDVLVFLHADSRLPGDAHASLAATRAAGGNFALRFGGGDRFARILTRAYAFQRRFGFYYGDSTIWMRPDTFAALGGYRDLPIMDDYDLVRRMEKRFDTACLPGPGGHLAAAVAGALASRARCSRGG